MSACELSTDGNPFAEGRFRQFDEKHSSVLWVEAVGQSLPFVLKEVSQTGVGHQVDVFVDVHILLVAQQDSLDRFPLLVADEEPLSLGLLVATMLQDEPMEVGKGFVGVNLELEDKVLDLSAYQG